MCINHAMGTTRCSCALLPVVLIWCMSLTVTFGTPDERRLIHALLNNYDDGVRPVSNQSDRLIIRYGLSLISVLDVADAEDRITLSVSENHKWNDPNLQWDPAEFGSVDRVSLPPSRVWTPDLTLYNAVRKTETSHSSVTVAYDGTVKWRKQSIMHVMCSFRESRHQLLDSCGIKISSFAYDGFKMDLEFIDDLEEIDLNDYIRKNDITIYTHEARKGVAYYPCCIEPYVYLTFNLTFSRKNDLAIGIPVTVVCLCLASLCVFLLPFSRSARITLGASILIGYILVLILSALLKPQGKIMSEDLFGILMMMITTCVLIGCSVVALVLHEKAEIVGAADVPNLVRRIFINILARVMCVQCGQPILKSSIDDTKEARVPDAELMQNMDASSDVIRNIEKRLQLVSDFLIDQQRARVNKSEWRIVAQVCDRFFFIVFAVIFVIFISIFI